MRHKVICGLALFGLVALATAAVAEEFKVQEVERARVCMMQDEVEPKAGTPFEYEGKTYYTCCPMCADSITKEPERYTKAKDPERYAH